jgi:diguanylate cyclase (GGDEF)-like protein
MEKIIQLGDSDLAFLLLLEDENLVIKSISGKGSERLINRRFSIKEENLFSRILREEKSFSLDAHTKRDKVIEEFENEFGLNAAFITFFSIRSEIKGLVGVGNKRGVAYRNDDIRLMDIFVKQIIIAIENDILTNRISHLEIKDALTGLYNESFIRNRLEEEIKRAITYQRPCSFILFSVDKYKEFCSKFNAPIIEAALKKIALVLKESISDIDKAARFSDNEFAIVLPEKNKRQAQSIAEEIRKKIEYLFKDEPKERQLTVSVGVAENPIDGISSSELINKAKEVL